MNRASGAANVPASQSGRASRKKKGRFQEIPDPRRIMPARQQGDPQLPGSEKQDQRLERALNRQVLDQPVRQLRDGKDKDEIEEQFDLGDARAALLVADTALIYDGPAGG